MPKKIGVVGTLRPVAGSGRDSSRGRARAAGHHARPLRYLVLGGSGGNDGVILLRVDQGVLLAGDDLHIVHVASDGCARG